MHIDLTIKLVEDTHIFFVITITHKSRLLFFIRCLSNIFLHLSPAYRLKKCPPPPVVENAEVIYEDEDFQIGNNPD